MPSNDPPEASSNGAASNGAASSGASSAREPAVLESMTLLATLSTAAEVGQQVQARRAGRDPAAQEPPDVAAPELHAAARDVQDLLMQLMLGRVHLEHRDEAEMAAAVRHFDALMKLRRTSRHVHTMHQRLLSLYPDVSEELVEEARIVEQQAETLLDADVATFVDRLDGFLERALGLVTWVRHEVRR